MGFKRLAIILVLSLCCNMGCDREQNSLTAPLDKDVHTSNYQGALKAMERALIAANLEPQKRIKIRLRLERGYELSKKYSEQIEKTVWIIDKDTDRKLFGTLYGAASSFVVPQSGRLNLEIWNATDDEVTYSVRIENTGELK